MPPKLECGYKISCPPFMMFLSGMHPFVLLFIERLFSFRVRMHIATKIILSYPLLRGLSSFRVSGPQRFHSRFRKQNKTTWFGLFSIIISPKVNCICVHACCGYSPLFHICVCLCSAPSVISVQFFCFILILPHS